jgi:phosphate transport system substrate-binding protein
MSKKLYELLAVLVAGAMLFAACTPAAPTAKAEEETSADEAETLSGQLQLAGSTTIQPLAEVWAEGFMDMHPDVVIEVQGGGSSVGVSAAGEGTADIGMSSREIKDSEFETFPNLQVFTAAYDGIAIIVHPDIELPSLSVEQIRAIFGGEITNFSEVGGTDAAIVVVSREEGSGTRGAFEDLVMKYKDDAGEKQEVLISETALLQQSNGQVRTVVAETPNTIAYLSFGYLDDSVKIATIDSVEPTVDNVKNGSYGIFRPLNLETGGDPSPLAQAFLDYILGADGQAVVADEGYMTVD